MAVGSSQVAVGAGAPVLLASVPAEATNEGPLAAVTLLPDTVTDVFLGGANVTAATGVKLLHLATPTLQPPIPLFAGDALYAIAGSGSATIGVLQT